MSVSPARRAFTAAWAVVLLAVSAAACSQEPTARPPAPSPTPIARLNTAGMKLPRIEFCSLVPSGAVKDALGAKPEADSSWGNGDQAAVTPTVRDVVHELGCEWRGSTGTSTGTSARAWVFARPVDQALARTVIRAGGRERGCRVVTGPEFGTPAATQVCQGSATGVRVRHTGLFGETWLSCEVTGPAGTALTDVRSRADAWCVQVAEALDAAS